MDDDEREEYIAQGAAAPTPPLPDIPDGAFSGLSPLHRIWAWKAYNYSLDLMDIHLAHIRIATMTGDMGRAMIVTRSLHVQMHQAIGMLTFMEASHLKEMTERPGALATQVRDHMTTYMESVGEYQLGDLVEALGSKGWSGYWLEMKEQDSE